VALLLRASGSKMRALLAPKLRLGGSQKTLYAFYRRTIGRLN